MTVADDLATLGRLLAQSVSAEQFGPELARVEAEIARLTLELRTAEDAMLVDLRARQAAKAEVARLRDELDEAQGQSAIWQDSSGAYCERMVAAEAEVARLTEQRDMLYRLNHKQIDLVQAAEAEVARRDEQIVELQKEIDGMARAPYGEYQKMRERMEAAEGREARLQDGLRDISEAKFVGEASNIARALLAENGAATEPNRVLLDAADQEGLRKMGAPVRCCGEWPECSHMLAFIEKRGGAA